MATTTDVKSAVTPAANNQPTPEAVVATAGAENADSPSSGNPTDQVITIEVVAGGMTNVEAPVAVTGKYTGLDLAGPTKTYDKLLDFWLTRALDMGMIGTDLGQLFPINMKSPEKPPGIHADYIFLMGMGAPGEFSPSDVRFLMRNVTVAVKSTGNDRMCVPLFGTRRQELAIDLAAMDFLHGIYDGCIRFREIADSVSVNKQALQTAASEPLIVIVVEPDAEKAKQIYAAFKDLENEAPIRGVHLIVHEGDPSPPDDLQEAHGQNQDSEGEGTMLRVTRNGQAAGAESQAAGLSEARIPTDVFQFSAISGVAAVTVREVELSSYLVGELPKRMVLAAKAKDREDLGKFFTTYVVPNDFRNFLGGAKCVTLVLDETTACFPWELAAFEKYSATKALGRSMCVSRRFHSLLSPPPSSPPPLNDKLRVLVVADPAPEPHNLPGARSEGWAVVEALDIARRAWQGEYRITADIRIGPPDSKKDLDGRLKRKGGYSDLVTSADTCDPVEIAKLIVQEQYDIVHFAGHGVYDENHKRAGWVLHDKCLLSAQEIFRAREVPRLVFGNACFSAVTSRNKNPQGQLVGLAQAFFARGIPNYIGTGWEVDDTCACECARVFYWTLLGLKVPPRHSRDVSNTWATAAPRSIGAALLAGRKAACEVATDESSTWAAYQHYGRVNDKILCKSQC